MIEKERISHLPAKRLMRYILQVTAQEEGLLTSIRPKRSAHYRQKKHWRSAIPLYEQVRIP